MKHPERGGNGQSHRAGGRGRHPALSWRLSLASVSLCALFLSPDKPFLGEALALCMNDSLICTPTSLILPTTFFIALS